MFFAVWARGHILEVAVVASAVAVADLLLLNEVDHEEEEDREMSCCDDTPEDDAVSWQHHGTMKDDDEEEEHDLQHFHTADNDVNVKDGASFDFDTCCEYMEHMLTTMMKYKEQLSTMMMIKKNPR